VLRLDKQNMPWPTYNTNEANIAGQSEATAFGGCCVLRLASQLRSIKRHVVPMDGNGSPGFSITDLVAALS
jgi:hypothetical protein